MKCPWPPPQRLPGCDVWTAVPGLNGAVPLQVFLQKISVLRACPSHSRTLTSRQLGLLGAIVGPRAASVLLHVGLVLVGLQRESSALAPGTWWEYKRLMSPTTLPSVLAVQHWHQALGHLAEMQQGAFCRLSSQLDRALQAAPTESFPHHHHTFPKSAVQLLATIRLEVAGHKDSMDGAALHTSRCATSAEVIFVQLNCQEGPCRRSPVVCALSDRRAGSGTSLALQLLALPFRLDVLAVWTKQLGFTSGWCGCNAECPLR